MKYFDAAENLCGRWREPENLKFPSIAIGVNPVRIFKIEPQLPRDLEWPFAY